MASAVATPLERQFGRIAGVNQMTSTSQLGSTSIVLQFDLNRNIDAAGRDVQAAINAARSQLPANLPSNPTYRKANPADAPILILALTSDTETVPQMYDAADSILAQKLSQVPGVGTGLCGRFGPPGGARGSESDAAEQAGRWSGHRAQCAQSGQCQPGQRASLERKRSSTLRRQRSTLYRGSVPAADRRLPQRRAGAAGRCGRRARFSSVPALDCWQPRASAGIGGKPSVLIIIFRQPGANVIETVDRVLRLMPYLQSSISPAIKLTVAMDRTVTVRASVKDIEATLIISIILVILVVFAFLRTVRATIIPSIAVPLSLVGTFGGMYLLGYSLDNLSLMALAISTGFVVDDAIVVLENITRYVEQGMDAVQAAFKGAAEIGFTVISMSTSLVAVFIPLLLMGGIVGQAVSRVRGHAEHCNRSLVAGFSHHDAHHVRQIPAAAAER